MVMLGTPMGTHNRGSRGSRRPAALVKERLAKAVNPAFLPDDPQDRSLLPGSLAA